MLFPPPPVYFPVHDTFDTRPNLHLLGTDFGNGPLDSKVFQLDTEFPRYRESKLAARRERLGKHHLLHEFDARVSRGVAAYIIRRLLDEWPEQFALRGGALECALTGESLAFDGDWKFDAARSRVHTLPPYASSLDALASQVQEDMAVVTLRDDGTNVVAALHVCSPNHWSPEEKIGGDFAAVHAPIPEMTTTNERQRALVEVMVTKGPYVRFAWGLATDSRLNHHPAPPPETDEAEWKGRAFSSDGPLYIRVERQTTNPIPEASSSLFTIRTSFLDCDAIRRDPTRRDALVRAVRSMSPAALAYKGLADGRDAVLAYLEGK